MCLCLVRFSHVLQHAHQPHDLAVLQQCAALRANPDAPAFGRDQRQFQIPGRRILYSGHHGGPDDRLRLKVIKVHGIRKRDTQ